MAKPARITKAEKREIQRLQKNFRAKFSRLIKQGVSRDLLPPQTTSFLSGYESRSEINEVKRAMKSFTSRGNWNYQFEYHHKDGKTAAIPKSDMIKIKVAQKQINRAEKMEFNANRNKEYKIISDIRSGEKTANRTVGQDRRKEKPLQYTKKEFSSVEEARAYGEKLFKAQERKRDRSILFKENFKKAVNNKFSKKQADEIIEAMKGLSYKDFSTLYDTYDVFNFDYAYYHDIMGQDGETAKDDIILAITDYKNIKAGVV